uniref:Uncharacterized protein n=1 Tax=Cajanus cajan TaxID=3821 RepID=A0A151UC97_CAJCA|nr:hypothetical protein KK1_021140 [Cajanus cajan]
MKLLIVKCKPETSCQETLHEKTASTRGNEGKNVPKHTIRVPSPFPYESDKVVPWIYDVQSFLSLESSNITGISQDKFDGIVSHITTNNHLTFIENEKPNGRLDHNKPLHISIKCKDFLIAKVLVDNGSSLNVLPKSTFDKIMVKEAQMQLSNMIV